MILAALPSGVLVFVLAQQVDITLQRSTAVIVISTVVLVVTLSALFVGLGGKSFNEIENDLPGC